MSECRFISDITVDLVQQVGNDSTLVAAAHVSTQGMEAEEKPGDHKGLINYLMKHRHGTPFEHGCMTFRVHAPIFVWREWHRHRIGFSYNEESGRYKQLEPVFYVPPADRPMFKVDNWRAGRPKFTCIETEDERARYLRLVKNLKDSAAFAYECYQENLDMGFDPGLARDCLPVNTYSACWVTCNPRSMMAFLSLRVGTDASLFRSYPLYEIDVAARKVEEMFANLFPITYEAFIEARRVGP